MEILKPMLQYLWIVTKKSVESSENVGIETANGINFVTFLATVP